MSTTPEKKCSTCYGAGEIGSEFGPQVCPDCAGLGSQIDPSVLIERRLRDIEGLKLESQPLHETDVRWLVFEVRRSRDALVRILSRLQDAEDDDVMAKEAKFIANQALGFYDVD
jgi:hypothetical protein